MPNSGGYTLLPSADIEKVNFWKKPGRLQTIPLSLLVLSGYVDSYKEAQVVGESGGKTITGPIASMPEGTEILFWAPDSQRDKGILQDILEYLEEKRRAITLVEGLIARYQSKNLSTDYMRRKKDRMLSPLIAVDGSINSFFDMLRFKVSEVGMSELRQVPGRARAWVEDRERELNND